MKIYLDFVLLLNFFFDFLLLFSTNYILKRNTSFRRIFIGSIIGALSILFLFMKINSFILFLGKLFISILMILVTFSYHNIKYFFKNISTLYIISVFLGGSLYLINDSFSYKNTGIIFFHNGLSINIILMILLTPVIICLYIKDNKNNKTYHNVHQVDIYYQNNIYHLSGFLDTGNNLKDPYKGRGVIIFNKDYIKVKEDEIIYVPFKTIDNNGLMKCFKIDKVLIDKNIEFKNLLGGISSKAQIEGIDCILPNKIKEELS